MLNSYQLDYVNLLQDAQGQLTDAQKEQFFDVAVKQAAADPEFGKQLDAKVASVATIAGYEPDTVVRLLTHGPNFKAQVEPNEQGFAAKTIPQMMREHINPIASNLLRVQAKKFALDAMQEPQKKEALRSPLKTAAVFLSNGYSVLNSAEKTFFAVTPLPMKHIKTALQVTLPSAFLASGLGQNLPIIGGAIAAAQSATNFVTSGAANFAGSLARSAYLATHAIQQPELAKGVGSWVVNNFRGMGYQAALFKVNQTANFISGAVNGGIKATLGVGLPYAAYQGAKNLYLNRQNFFQSLSNPGIIAQGKLNIERSIIAAQQSIAKAKSFLTNKHREMSMSTEKQDAIGVSESFNSLEARRKDAERTAVEMSPATNPSFVVQGENLIPAENLRFSIGTYETIANIYDLSELKQGQVESGDRVLDKLQVVSPAKVQMNAEGNYEVTEKGKVTVREAQVTNAQESVVQQQVTPASQPTVIQPEPLNKPVPEPIAQKQPATQEEKDPEPFIKKPAQEQESEQQVMENAQKMAGKSTNDKEYENFALDLKNKLAQRGVPVENFQIDYNGKNVFKSLANGSNIQNSEIHKEAFDALKQIQTDYTNFKGEIKITAGGKTLLHVKDGQLLHDAIGMAQSAAKVEVSTPGNALYKEASQDVRSQGHQRLQDIGKQAFSMGHGREQVMEALKEDLVYQQQKEARGEQYANQTLAAVVANAQVANARDMVMQNAPTQERKKEPAMSK